MDKIINKIDEACEVCNGHGYLASWYGNQAHEFVLSKCPSCNGGNLTFEDGCWVEKPIDSSFDNFDEWETLSYDKIQSPRMIQYAKLKLEYDSDIVADYILDNHYFNEDINFQEWYNERINQM